uniref:Tc1-like transposase DDE domain-containing protein n=1 Tax=Nothobranchius furzeri TaxID=105023 RepID=A0A8C6LB75_NOTFU
MQKIPEAFKNSQPGSLLKTAIMGKTADLTAVQKAIIDTLRQEGKTQKEISERIGCSQSAVSRHLSGKSVGMKKCGRKHCTTRRGDWTLRKIVEKDRFQNLEDLQKQWTESGVETSRATVNRRVREMGYRCHIPQVKPHLNQKQRQKRLTWATEKQHWTVAQWSKVLFSNESKLCMSFGNQGVRVWRKTGQREMPKCLKSSVKYPQSVMVWGAMSAAGVGPLCFIKGRVNAVSYQEILEHFMLPSAEKLYGDEDFIFQHDLAPAHSSNTTGEWFTDHGITVLNWPANSPDLNPIENLWNIVKRKLRDARPNRKKNLYVALVKSVCEMNKHKHKHNTLDELKAAIEASWASITPQQCHRLIASMPRRIEAVISAKGFPTKY